MTSYLNEVQLMKSCPSIFATSGAERVSDRYAHIPTIEVVRGLQASGFYPVLAKQSNARLEERKNFTKHIMRFRRESQLQLDGAFPEIVLVNSHDGSTSYQMRAGIYRLVCSNGLIVGDDICCHRIHHKGNVIEKVVQSAHEIIDVIPTIIDKSSEWKGIPLKKEHKLAFAEVAASLKWDKDEMKIEPHQLIQPRRMQDAKDDLWTTFNVVQENIIRGGVRYHTDNGRQSTRSVASVGENVRLNTALWALTERMAQLV